MDHHVKRMDHVYIVVSGIQSDPETGKRLVCFHGPGGIILEPAR